ncbi:hypothetical protein DP113_27110 [Brasilonema octagenarum UFV-E1]|uniref:Uncharacterized protein n=1 Tax=Brasilonema sennae CENA114 TaxID=415709 RepID=A0A856MP72_9CYAN|nr:hypothetical protein [Brasilonema sennae]QDL11087.1 hypothetical protein DP114_27180 [Brasilonema sennae CENA114]QDL17432.1 hypothetical protein DP113_27110 [Brasilonema octagenarum UFV-E1]
MTISIAQNITTFLEDLKSADLIGISLLPQNVGLRLEFTFGPESGDAKIELYRIVHLVISQPLNTDDEDFCFWVGEVELKKIEEGESQILSALSYPFKDSKGSIETDSSLIYFRLEGDICVEVVCGNYKIFQEI